MLTLPTTVKSTAILVLNESYLLLIHSNQIHCLFYKYEQIYRLVLLLFNALLLFRQTQHI